MSKSKKLVAMMIMTIACIQLVACGKATETSGEEVSKYVYVPEYQNLSDAESLQNICLTSDKIFYTNYKWDEETGISSTTLNVLKIGETVPTEIPVTLEENSYINNMQGDSSGNIWLLTNRYIMDELVENGGTSVFQLVKIDEQGNQISDLDITYLLEDEENAYFQYMELDGAGNIYLSNSDSSIWVLDPEGKLLFTIAVDNWINSIGVSKDGTVLVSQYGTKGEELKSIDVASKGFGSTYTELPVSQGNTSMVPGITSDILINSGSELIEYNLETNEKITVLNWIDCDVDSNNLRSIRALEDGRIVAITTNYSDSGSATELIYLTKKESSEVKTKTILTFGTMSLNSEVRSAIINFNKTNENYRISVKEYLTDYDDYEATLAKFNSDVSTGNGTDIIDLSYGVTLSNYASKGVFEDIYPYIEKDSEIKLDDYLENIVSAYEIDGKLYGVITNFYISSLLGKTSDVGEEMGWQIDELIALLDSRPKGTKLTYGATKSSILSTCLMYDMNQFINWETGECSFNSESFQKILELSNRFDAEFSYDQDGPSEPSLIQSGQQLLMNTSIMSVEEFQMYKLMFGEDVTFIGFPTETGNGSVITPCGASMAMNSNSKNKDGAWEFMRHFLTEEYQSRENSWGFPVLQSALDEMFEKSMKSDTYEDENGEIVEQSKTSWSYSDWTAEIFAATEEEVTQLKGLIDSVKTVNNYDQQIYTIIAEEAEAYFSGSKNAKEVAEIIQSRVQIYVNETK